MRAGLYARVSREEQAEGYSLDAQLDAMRRYAAGRGWIVAAEYSDPGYTGTVSDRPAFSRALADAEAGKIDILLTHQLDRFYRNLQAQLDTLGRLGRWGVGYLSVTEQIDYSTPQGMLFLQMLGAFNEYYVANLSRETKKGKRGRAMAGRSNASTVPLGYRRQDGHDVIDEATAPAVRLAFEAYATGEHSDLDVARLLNEAGIAASGRAASGRWTREGVRFLLGNPFYVGLVRYGEELHDGQHEPLVARELWDRVQARRRDRRQGPTGHGRQAQRVYLLAKLARCSCCGLPLVAQMSGGHKGTRGGRTTYYCPARRRSLDCAAGQRSVRAWVLDEQIGELVGRLRLPADWRDRLQAMAGSAQDHGDAERKRRSLDAKLRRTREVYMDGGLDRGEYTRRKAKIEADLAGLEAVPAPAVQAAGETLESLGAAWATATDTIRAEILRLLFESVVVDLDEGRVVCVRPRPAFAVLFRMDGLHERQEGCFWYENGAA